MGWLGNLASKVKEVANSKVVKIIQVGLDIAGFLPVVGTVADLANAAIYTAQGDYKNAALSAMSAVPGVGDAIAATAKSAKVLKAAKIMSKADVTSLIVNKLGTKAVKGLSKVGGKLCKKVDNGKMFEKIKNISKKKCLNGKCFTGETLIYTEKGYIPIKDIEVGDLVYSRDENTGETGLKRVEKTSETTAHTIYAIHVENTSTIKTTAYHPFYIEEKGWVNAINLKEGDSLEIANGKKSITSIEKTRHEEPVTVYNMDIEDWESYFITEDNIYVHNGAKHVTNKTKTAKKSTKMQGGNKRKKVADPIDAVTGVVFYENIDFELPGYIPLTWERKYFSDSIKVGILGHGTFTNYETEIIISDEEIIILTLPDGRAIEFDKDFVNGSQYNRIEKLTLRKDSIGYQVYNHSERLIYHYEKVKEISNTYNLIAIKDEAGHSIKFNYDDKNLINIIDSVGRTLNITNDKQGRITEIKHNNKTQVSYSYNETGDLVKIKDALGQAKTIEYKNHLMTKSTTKDGYSFYWEYDGTERDAKCIHAWGDNGALEYHFEYSDNISHNTNGLGYRETIHFNNSDLITKFIDSHGNTTTYEYNEYEEMISVTNALGQKTTFIYDDRGNIIEQIEASGAKTAFKHDDNDRIIKVTYPNGGETKWEYKQNGSIEKIIYPDQSETKYNYNENSLISEIENALGHKTKLSYDKWGNVTEVIQPDGSKGAWEYDEKGNCTKAINPLGAEQKLYYDALNRVVKVEMPDGNTIHLKYNAYDEVLTAKDNQQTVNFEYTWSGKLKKRQELNRTLEFVYDTEEQLKTIINEKGEKYLFDHDGNGNIIEEIGFGGIKQEYKYDKAGRLTQVKQVGDNEKISNMIQPET